MNTALARLRAKTDRELGTLIRKEIERAKSEASCGNAINAEKRLNHVENWLAVAGLTSAERSALQRSIRAVRARVEAPETACA